MTGRKNENKKIRKKFQRTIYILRLKFSEKIFLQKSRIDSVAVGAAKGGMAYYSTQQANTSTKRTYRIYIDMVVSFNTCTIIENGVFDALVQCVRFSFLCGNIIRARQKCALKIGFLCARRGGSLLFMPFARFCFLPFMLLSILLRVLFLAFYVASFSFFVFVLSSLAVAFFGILLFVLCVLLFPLLTYLLTYLLSFLLFVGFLSFLRYIVVRCFLYIYNIINKISIISFVCVRMCTHTRAHDKDAVNIRHKNRAARKPP